MFPKRKYRKRSKATITNIPNNEEELSFLEKIVLKTGSEVFDDASSEDDSDDETPSKKERIETKKEPAWVDEDDNFTYEEIAKKQGKRKMKLGVSSRSKNYKEVMEKKYQEVMGLPKWSLKKKKKDNAEELFNSCGKFIEKPKFLNRDLLEHKILKQLNFETQAEGSFINVVKFHPKSTVAMVAGNSGLVSLFQVNGKTNPKLQSMHYQKYPIHCGSFLKNGEEILIGSQHYKYFHSYNLMTGKSIKVNNSKIIDIKNTKNFLVSPNDDFIAVCGISGTIFLFTVSTKEYVDSFQMNCEVTALSFNSDGSLLYSHGDDGEVYVWDMKTRSCVKKFFDDGCLKGTSICTSNNDQFIACGSSSGVVNIYDTESIKSGDFIRPTKTVYNLVTPVTNLEFNNTGEILFMASSVKDNALRLLHCPSMSVFSNFPQSTSKIKRPLSVDFSPNSGFLAIGDNNGQAHLLRLKFYGNY